MFYLLKELAHVQLHLEKIALVVIVFFFVVYLSQHLLLHIPCNLLALDYLDDPAVEMFRVSTQEKKYWGGGKQFTKSLILFEGGASESEEFKDAIPRPEDPVLNTIFCRFMMACFASVPSMHIIIMQS